MFLFLTFLYLTIISFATGKICELVDLDILNNKKILYILLIIFLIYFSLYQISCYNKEGFDVDIKGHDVYVKMELKEFFNFVEYFQINDMDSNTVNNISSSLLSPLRHEKLIISEHIRNILKLVHYIIYVNNKDNFYHRYLLMKWGSNLSHYVGENPNYDRMVRAKIKSKYTFLPENEYDRYYPRPSIDSEHQQPNHFTINIHDYYTYENTEINLLVLKKLLELVQLNDNNMFGDIVKPTEHVSFDTEFVIPLKSILNSIRLIIETDAYRNYIKKYKFGI